MKWTTHVNTFGRTYTSGDWSIHHSFADPGEESYYQSYYDGHCIDVYVTLAEAKRGAKLFMKIEQDAGRDRLETLAMLNTLAKSC